MTDLMTTSGLVATVPRHLVTGEGLPLTSFRLAAGQRKYNRSTKSWEYSTTNWYTVTAFRQLAINLAGSIAKGDRVVVSGRLHIREWESGDRGGTVVEIDADLVGHDLNWGTAAYTRSIKSSVVGAEAEAVEVNDQGESGRGFDPDEASLNPAIDSDGWALSESPPLLAI